MKIASTSNAHPVDRRITVALVEDIPSTRARLEEVIAATPSLQCVYSAGTAGEILDWLREGRPDVLLVDHGLPDRPGLEVIRACRSCSPLTEIMVITIFGDEASMIAAFEAGARGYLLKDGTEEELARHVMDLHAGGSPMSPLFARQLVARITAGRTGRQPPQSCDLVERLSPREAELLSMVARGYTYAEVGRLMSISLGTVQTHVKSIYGKLDVHSKTEAVFEARQMGLLGP